MPGPVTETVGSRMVARFGACRFGTTRFGFAPRDTETHSGIAEPIYRHQPATEEYAAADTHTTVEEP
jgi:hypothetical protein